MHLDLTQKDISAALIRLSYIRSFYSTSEFSNFKEDIVGKMTKTNKKSKKTREPIQEIQSKEGSEPLSALYDNDKKRKRG